MRAYIKTAVLMYVVHTDVRPKNEGEKALKNYVTKIPGYLKNFGLQEL